MAQGASCPEELVEGMESLMQKMGTSTSFLDRDYELQIGEGKDFWQKIMRGIINPVSYENKCFEKNMTNRHDHAKKFVM